MPIPKVNVVFLMSSTTAMLEVLGQLDPYALNPGAVARVIGIFFLPLLLLAYFLRTHFSSKWSAMMVKTCEGHRELASLQVQQLLT